MKVSRTSTTQAARVVSQQIPPAKPFQEALPNQAEVRSTRGQPQNARATPPLIPCLVPGAPLHFRPALAFPVLESRLPGPNGSPSVQSWPGSYSSEEEAWLLHRAFSGTFSFVLHFQLRGAHDAGRLGSPRSTAHGAFWLPFRDSVS